MMTISSYTEDEGLKNIVTGVIADESVNVHLFQANGEELLQKMEGKEIFNYTFKRSERSKTLGSKSAVKFDDSSDISIIQHYCFKDCLSDYIKYELSSYPPTLFESPSMQITQT